MMECVFPGKENGYFIEAVASPGLWASSCYLLDKEMNWSDIYIEPNDVFFEQLVITRPNSICEQVCVSNRTGVVNFIQGKEGPEAPYLSSIKEKLEQFKHGSEHIRSIGQCTQKAATTLENLLDKQSAPAVIDYEAFDMEGSEIKVLKTFSFDRYQFLALSLECDAYIWDDITTLLSTNGYKEVKNPFNTNMLYERYWLNKTLSSA